MMLQSFIFSTIFLMCQLVLAQGQPPQGQPNQQQQPSQPAPMANQPTNTSPGGVPLRADGEIALTSEGAGRRDPFTLPLYIINKLQVQSAPPPSRIDASIEAIRRWPLVSYSLVGIIWDVKMSKALIRDQEGKMHILKVKDRIGYDNGVITDIREGSVTVLENQIPQVLRLKK